MLYSTRAIMVKKKMHDFKKLFRKAAASEPLYITV